MLKSRSGKTTAALLGLLLFAAACRQGDPGTRFVGEWTNKDLETRGITRIHIRQFGGRILVHMWGRCHPKECDWGDATAREDEQALSVTWESRFAARDQKLALLADGSLQLQMHTHFIDRSKRPDRDDTYTFVKGPAHNWSDPPTTR